MKIKQVLREYIPDAYYSDGTKSTCLMYKICNMFDIDSQSFKEVKEKKNMESNDYKNDSDYGFMRRYLALEKKSEQNKS